MVVMVGNALPNLTWSELTHSINHDKICPAKAIHTLMVTPRSSGRFGNASPGCGEHASAINAMNTDIIMVGGG